MSSAVRRFLSTLTPPPAADPLARYAATGDPDAFAALVARHGPLVLGVCRRALGAGADADDAFQAVFLTLVRRAGRVRNTTALSAWLHRVAVRTASRARRRRRPTLPLTDVAGPGDPAAVAAAAELRGLLDAELDRLPHRLRGPVVLCLLDGMTRDAAAGRLGWSASTVKRRLAAGRALLRSRLARRGLPAVTAGATADGLRAGVPDALAAATGRLAGPRPAVSPAVAALAAPGSGRWMVAAVILLAAAVGAGQLAGRPVADPPGPAPAPAPVAAKSAEPPGFFLWPVRTDLQRAYLREPADALLLVHAGPAVADGGADLRRLPLADLRRTLRASRADRPRLAVQAAFIGDRGANTAGPDESVRLALAGFCHELGYERVRSVESHRPRPDWATLVTDLRLTADVDDSLEPAAADGPVTAYPVRTPLSRFLTGGDAVLEVGPRPTAAEVPADVRAAAARAVGQLDVKRKRIVTFVLQFPEGEDARQPLIAVYQQYAKELGFESGTVTLR